MTKRVFDDDDLESGRVDPDEILSGDARHKNAPTSDDTEQIEEGTATAEDLRKGKVDPDDVLDGSVDVNSPSEASSSFTVDAEALADEQTRRDFAEKAESTTVTVSLSGDENIDLFARSWAEKNGAEVVE